MALSKVLSAKETARILGVKIGTLEQWRADGRGPVFLKLGSKIGYSEDVLAAYIDGVTFQNVSDAEKNRVPCKRSHKKKSAG